MDNLLAEALESQKVLGLDSINEETRKKVVAVNLNFDRVTAELQRSVQRMDENTKEVLQ
jgi:hypothetical protein